LRGSTTESGRLNFALRRGNAQELRALAGYLRFLGNVGFRFSRVAWHAKQLQIGFAVLSAVNKGDDVIICGTQPSDDG